MKNAFKIFCSLVAFISASALTAEARTWNYALEFHYREIHDSVTWEGELDSRLMTVPLEIENLGTLCARIKTKLIDRKTVNLHIEWGSQARTRRENGPGTPSETRCVIRAESKQSCSLKQNKGDRTSHCLLTLHNLLLAEVSAHHLGPGWTLDSPRIPLHITSIEGTFTLLP